MNLNNTINHQKIKVMQGSNIKPEPISWLWKNWIASGKLHILAGAPGTGKTTITMALAATISSGGYWPDGSRANVGSVVIWSGEDDPQDTLLPRLILANADVARVQFITGIEDEKGHRSFDPAIRANPLIQLLQEIGDARMVIIDPIISAVAGDSHKGAEVRRNLQPLVDLSASMGCALLGITHFSKATQGRDPIERLTGSIAFGALARIVFVVAKREKSNEANQLMRIFLRAKSNIGPDDNGFEYDIQQQVLTDQPEISASFIKWGARIEGTARDLLAQAEKTSSSHGVKKNAMLFLSELLANGPLDAEYIEEQCVNAGYSGPTIRRAKKELRIRSIKRGITWYWYLPEHLMKEDDQDVRCAS